MGIHRQLAGALALAASLAWLAGCIHYAPPAALTEADFAWAPWASPEPVATLQARLTQGVLVYGDRHGSWTYTAVGTPHFVTGAGGTTVAYMLMEAMYPHTGQITLGQLVFTPTSSGTSVRIGVRLGLGATQAGLDRRRQAYIDLLEGRPPWTP